MREPLETAELLAFTKIVEVKSMSRAASELGVPRATIGRRLARLEQRLGARLLRRTTRSLTVTDAGDTFYRHARAVLDAVQDAEASVRRADATIQGDLRVSAPPMNDESFFAMTSAFAREHPNVRLQVHFANRFVDLRRDGYDVALRVAKDIEPGLVARTLMRSTVIAVASPEYLAERGTPRRKSDLKKHRCLMGYTQGDLPQTHWPIEGGMVHVEGTFFSNDMRLLCDAAMRGLGIAFLDSRILSPHLQSGALVQVLPGIVEANVRLAVVYLERQLVPAQVRAFVNAVVAWAPTLGKAAPRSRR